MTEHPDRPGYSFDPGPPPEASRFFRNKGLRPSFGFEDVEPEEHAVAFAVAKMGEVDLLEAARAEVQKALDEGLPFEAFQKSWRNNPKLSEWWGKKEMADPLTGELVEAQLGSPKRLKTIYRANLASARAAGQWERIERTKAMLPFLEYRLGPSERHRPHHEAKAGMILPVDSAFWDEWMPPNGWGCKCWVRQLTRREAERRGIATTPDIPDMKYRNPRTGSVAIVPQGIDPGWQRNPGKLRLQAVEGMLKERLEAAPEAVQRAALKDIATSWRVVRVLQGAAGSVPVALMPDAARAAVGGPSRLIAVTPATKAHIVDDMTQKGQASRAPFVADLAQLPDATDGFLERREDGAVSLHLFVDGLYPGRSQSGARRGLYVVIWFDDGPDRLARVRTLFPKAERSYWDKQAARENAEQIDLK
jgi:hypothetical protein